MLVREIKINMTKTMDINQTQESTEQLIGLYKHFHNNGDIERAEKTEALLKKLLNHEYIIAFCGHFSAGKSTMINSLLGENVLPSSPIPTSANLVKVHKSQEDFAKVFYRNEPPLLFQAPYDFAKVKEFCKNGDVREIEIGQSLSKLSDGVTVMDTPGVDSTDDAHRISTESAIHLANIVFYVMDYNHVQSELNFTYTKELLQNGVELYLIINQIDKHNEEELSFEEFKMSVKESFASWNVHPNGIFYTTLKKPNDKRNQFPDVKNLIDSTLKNKEERLRASTESSIHILVQEHFKWLKEQQEEKSLHAEEILQQYSEEKLATILKDEKVLTEQIEHLNSRFKNWQDKFHEQVEEILKTAYLMPYQTRELAEKYLESVQPDFKVGLFGKKKTVIERTERLQSFYQNLCTQVDSQLNWHLRQFAIKILKEEDIINDDLQRTAQNLTVEFDEEFISQMVKSGARLTGEYVLNYCDQIVERLQKKARVVCQDFKEKTGEILKRQIDKDLSALRVEWHYVQKATEAIKEIENFESERKQKEENIFKPLSDLNECYQALQNHWLEEEKNIRIYNKQEEQATKQEQKKQIIKEAEKETTKLETNDSLENIISKLNQAVTLLKNRKGFQRLIDNLALKAERLKNRKYTIALFGAFSAGKSSFANALLGEKVLPVSPNPTTAAINRICPPTKEHMHGTAAVHLKTEAQVLEDVQKSLKYFDQQCKSLAEAEALIPKLIEKENTEGYVNVHLSFLKAFHAGYSIYQDTLGQTLKTDMNEFRGFVANEAQSCFVESIDLFYDSELTRRGITLVDTPGADSINARHTGVAFEYIKQSDAILYVTYYNHAFSKADREFLIQLGRVKDAFELDKMFFMINAIDLADSLEEKEEVHTYVYEQLTQYGIRFPRLFGISSLLALTDRVVESRIDEFKKEFNHFLDNDLMQMTIQSAVSEYQKGLQMLDQFITTAQEGKEEKQSKKQKLKKEQEDIIQLMDASTAESAIEQFEHESNELLFYVKQRVFYRFPDFFKEAFNPSLIQKTNKSSLNIALDDLLQSLGYDFAQELRATSLRLENFIKETLKHRFNQIKDQITEIEKDITLSMIEFNPNKTPEFPNAFESISKAPLEKSFKYFKNANAFFEKNEKQKMQDELEEKLKPLADEYISEQEKVILLSYTNYINHEFSRMKKEIAADVSEQFNGWYDILDEHIDIQEWVEIKNQLNR